MIVRSKSGSYPIQFRAIGSIPIPPGSFVITDENVSKHYHLDAPTYAVEPGENSKSMGVYEEVLRWLANSGASRESTIVALGGGVVGDLAGFVAASYMRGIKLIQVPTSLLAQVDSSVGGKVGIDLPEGKNLVGAFWPPETVHVDIATLGTLPEREISNGMAEVWKYCFIADPGLAQLLQSERDWDQVVKRCIGLKAAIVQSDEFETSGSRATLNFGHTIGHAIESLSGFTGILHGEAVAIGMVVESLLGERLGITRQGTAAYVQECLRSEGLPTASIVVREVDAMIDAMRRDKKASNGKLAFSLLTDLGACTLVKDVPEADIREILGSI